MTAHKLSIKGRLALNSKYDQDTKCLTWTGCVDQKYGRININGLSMLVHRVSYEAYIGPIPEGRRVAHVCNNSTCISPYHLRVIEDEDIEDLESLAEEHGISIEDIYQVKGIIRT